MGDYTIPSTTLGSINNSDETTPLIGPGNATSIQPGKGSIVKDALRIVTALPTGMAQMYSTVGTIAVLTQPSLYILIPVAGGGAVVLAAEILEVLTARYPDNKMLEKLANVMKLPKDTVIAYLGDAGFVWSMMTTVAAQIGGKDYLHNAFAKFIAPLPSLISAGFVRYASYQRDNEREVSRTTAIFADTVKGMSSATFLPNLLQQQGVLSPTSWVPPAFIGVTGALGLVAGSLEKDHPNVAKKMMHVIDMITRLSLATSVFAFANDIYAASNKDDIPDAFFWGNVGVSSLYVIMLITMSVMTWCSAEGSEEDVADIENQRHSGPTIEELSDDDTGEIIAGSGARARIIEDSFDDEEYTSSSDSSDSSPPQRIATVESGYEAESDEDQGRV